MANMNQIYALLNAAQSEAWGKTALSVKDATTLIALGDYVLNSSNSASKDLFTGALTDMIAKTIFVSKNLTVDDLGITRDETEYGAVLRKVRVQPKGVQYNEEYDLNLQAFDPFAITVPTVSEQLYSKHTTFKSQITITDQQLFTAFSSDTEMMAFYALIFKQLDDSIVRATTNLDRLAVASYAAEKIKLQATQKTKTHAVNLLKAYLEESGASLTAAEAMNDIKFLRFFAKTMLLYKQYMATDTDIFNSSDGYPSQTPESYMNFYVLNQWDANLKTNLYADTYHQEMVKVDGYKTVPFWQATTNSFAFSTISKINVKPPSGGSAVVQDGILAIMMDKDAVVSTYRREQSESWRIPLKGTNHARTNTHMYINDLYENGIVFYIKDLE